MTANEKASLPKTRVNRRRFLTTAAGAGAGLALGRRAFAIATAPKGDAINLALIGLGNQGQVLLQSNLVKMAGHRIKAVCDILPTIRTYAQRVVKSYKHDASAYEDCRELLAAEKDLDAAIIATPDWLHAEHTIACLKAGLHVYCEKEMSNSLAKAREMVVAARETGKLLQIGHQRRSNPRYHVALDYIRNKKALGPMVFVEAHWNRPRILKRTWAPGAELDAAALKKHGYDTMDRLMNWRWFKQFSGGPIADLGSHQIDIFHWFLGALPKSVVAVGGIDYNVGVEWYDNVDALYAWDVPDGAATRTVRGFYQTLGASSHGGFTETFIGQEGSLIISEVENKGGLRREKTAPEADWEKPLQAEQKKAGAAAPKAEAAAPKDEPKDADLTLGKHSVGDPGRYYPPIPPMGKPEHWPHLENFFDAIRGKAKLTCPGDAAYETCVSVLRVNEAIEAGRPIAFKPEEFKA